MAKGPYYLKPTESGVRSQRPFGRVPVDILPILQKLSHLDAHVFLVGCILGNRFQGEVGLVPANKTRLAELCNTTRYRLIQSLRRLERVGLVKLHGVGWVFMTHYMEGVPSGDSVSSGATPTPQESKPTPQEPPFDSSGVTVLPELQLVQQDAAALYEYNNGGTAKPTKKRRIAPKAKVIWDSKEAATLAVDEKWRAEFRSHWIRELGEFRFSKELEKANNWLANPANAHRRSENSRLDQFLWKWMGRCEK